MAIFSIPTGNTFLKGNDYLIENPKANLLIITGMDEHSRRYEYFARKANERGYSVSVLDHFGQGENATSVETQQIWPHDAWNLTLKALNNKVNELRKQEKPVYIMGHSMGSFFMQSYLEHYPNTIDKMVIMSSNGPQKALYAVANLLAKITTTKKNWNKPSKFIQNLSLGGYTRAIKNRKTDVDWLSYNEENIKNYLNDPYCGATNTCGFYHEFLGGMNTLYKKKNLQNISKDEHIYIVCGDSDPVGQNSKGLKDLYNMYKKLGVKDVTLRIHEHMRHEILNEDNKDQVIKEIIDFLDK